MLVHAHNVTASTTCFWESRNIITTILHRLAPNWFLFFFHRRFSSCDKISRDSKPYKPDLLFPIPTYISFVILDFVFPVQSPLLINEFKGKEHQRWLLNFQILISVVPKDFSWILDAQWLCKADFKNLRMLWKFPKVNRIWEHLQSAFY